MEKKTEKKHTFIRLIKDIKKYYLFIFIAILGMLLMSGAQLISPLITRKLVSLITDKDPDIAGKALIMGGILLGLYLLQSFGQHLRSYFAHIAAWRYINDLRIKLYDHIQHMSLGFFHNRQTGELISRISTDTTNLEPLIAHAIPDITVNSIIFIGSAIVIFTINYKLALMSLCTVPVMAVLVYIYATKFRPRFKRAHEKMGGLVATLSDELSGVREISAFNKYEHEEAKVDNAANNHKDAILSALLGSAIFNPAILFASNLGLVAVIVFGGKLAGVGDIDAADIVAFMMYVAYFYQPITSLTQIFEQINTAMTAVERSYEILDTENEMKDGTFEMPKCSAKGDIEFKNVSFSYDDGKQVLKDLNFKLPAGKSLALVGPTGIGKTTITNLVARFYDVNEGEVLVDGVNVKEWKLESLRNQMSIVLQDVFLFTGTISENIAFGADDPTEEQIHDAGVLSNSDEFIKECENGYDTFIGERGVKLSGGQKQRLSIARAVLRNTPILILDEATAAVDTKTEKLIQDALDKLSINRTTIVVAHRLTTVKNCDYIAVIGEEGIQEIGTHEELLKKKGKYWELLNL